MKKITTLVACLCSMSVFSQWSYTANYFPGGGNPGAINTETDATTTGWNVLIAGPQAANIWSPVYTLPFAFNFYGSPVTQLRASQNGVITFSEATNPPIPSSTNGNLPDATLPDSTICGFWDSFTAAPPTGSGDNVYYKVIGTAPNQQLWIRWYSFEMGNPNVAFLYFAIVLEETSNAIYVVDQYNTTPALTFTSGVQLNGTTAVQYGTNTLAQGTNGTANTDNDYHEYLPIFISNDNAGISAFLSPPSPYNMGLHNIDVDIMNYGANALTSATVNWEINGAPQTPFAWAGNVASGMSSGAVTIGSYNFPAGSTTLKAWTTLPNGVADTNPPDDTLEVTMCSALNGVYTVGGITPDFIDMNAAITALTSCGVTGPTVFNVAPGNYIGNFVISNIPGTSATNTVLFDGGSTSTTTLANNVDAIVHLQGADYVTFRNFTFIHAGNTNSWGVRLSDATTYCTIDSCIFQMTPTVGNLNVIAIVASASNTDDFAEGDNCHHCTFSNLTITGGEMAFHLEGSDVGGVPSWGRGNAIINNTISTVDDYGVYVDNQDSLVISGNSFTSFNETVNADGLYLLDLMNMEISNNYIHAPDWGIYILDGNFDAVASGQSSIRNNMVKSNADYAAYLDGINNIDVYHNTFYGNPGLRINDVVSCNFRNNIFTSDADFAFESDDVVPTGSFDYNLYWTPSTNSNFVKFGTPTYANLVDWQAAAPIYNANSVQVQPHFVSATDLHRIGFNGNDIGDNTVGITDDIDGDARPLPPSVTVDLGADEFTPASTDDAIFVSLVSPTNWICGDSALPVTIVLSNFGDTIYTMPVTIQVTGSTTQNFNYTYTGPLGFGQYDTVTVGTINVYNGGNITVEGWTALVGEQNPDDDTLSPVSFNVIPAEPIGFDTTVCGPTGLLTAQTGYPVTYAWYDAPTGGNLVGTGNTFMVPNIPVQGTYYLQYSGSTDSMTTTYASNNGCGGGAMFDITSTGGTVISGFDVNCGFAAGTAAPVSVYYKIGTYLGNETNAGAWTLESTYNLTSAGPGNPTTFNLANPIVLSAGVTYGIYIQYEADYTNGTNSFVSANGDVTVQAGAGLCGAFSSAIAGRIFNGEIRFSSTPCSNVRTPVTADNFPGPTASFTNTNVGPTFTFTNTSVNENSVLFIFGDGNQSTNDSPTYTYSTQTGGNYTVCLVAYGTCVNDTICEVIYSPGLSVEEIETNMGMKIVPNPTDGQFTLSFQTVNPGQYTVQVYSIVGQQLFTESFSAGTGTTTRTYDVSGLTPGSYMVRIHSEKERAIQRLIVK